MAHKVSRIFHNNVTIPNRGCYMVQVLKNVSLVRTWSLEDVAKKHGIKIGELKPGQLVFFINAQKTMLRAFGVNRIMISYRSKRGPSARLTIQEISEWQERPESIPQVRWPSS